MGRSLASRVCGALLALLAGCYAVPERHAVSNDPSEPEPGSDAQIEENDAAVAMDAAVDSGEQDASVGDALAAGCDCSDLARPVCISATKSCVACTAGDRGSCRYDQHCDALRGECVDCMQNSDCPDPAASVCDSATHTCQPCTETSASDCSHIAGKQVCLAGACVQCTKDKLAACVVQQSSKSVQNACHALEHTCTANEIGKTPSCGECVSDAQCAAGNVCVAMEFGGQPIAGKWYCQPVLKALNCGGERPFVTLATGELTVDGAMRDICTLPFTSCSALNDYRSVFCGLDQNDQPVALNDAGMPAQPTVKGDNARCGLLGVDDAYCVETQPGLHRCTVPCGELSDCPKNAPACSAQAHATGTDQLCKVP